MPNAAALRRLATITASVVIVFLVAAPLARAAWPTMPTGRYRMVLLRVGADSVEALCLTPTGARVKNATITLRMGWTDPDSAFRAVVGACYRPRHAPLWDTLLIARATLPGYVGQCWVEHAQVPGVRRDSLTMQPRWAAPLLVACDRGRDTVRIKTGGQ